MNCKKGIGLFLALMILVSNVGWAFTMHYCGGKLASVSIQTISNSSHQKKSCCAPKALKKESCCKNKKVQIEKKSDHAILKAFSFEPYVAYLVPEIKKEIVTTKATFIHQTISTYYCDAHSPPLFKLYHQFIFYA